MRGGEKTWEKLQMDNVYEGWEVSWQGKATAGRPPGTGRARGGGEGGDQVVNEASDKNYV